MAYHETKFAQQYTDLIGAFKAAFPHVTPPDSTWFAKWLSQYRFGAIMDAIRVLQAHSPAVHARYDQESTGRALSALLRQDAARRAVNAANNKVRP